MDAIKATRSPRSHIMLWIAAALIACAGAQSVNASDVVSLTTSLVALDGERVRVDVINNGASAAEIQTRDTPFDAVHAHPFLLVERSVKRWSPMSQLAYIGRHTKRVPPQAHEVLVLQPGEQASAIVDVGSNYQVTHAEPHRVRLAHAWQARALGTTARARTDAATVRTVRAEAETVLTLAPRVNAILRARPPSFDGCSVTQQEAITAAADVAERMTLDAVAALDSASAAQRDTSPRYDTWFGTYTADRYERVQQNFAAIADAFANETVNYVCGCTEPGVYAFVFPQRPYDIYLCPVFWRANIDGTDSRAGTIVHELSHFTVVAGTDDHRYSQSGTQQLARTNPELSVDNADTHEYFAENTPFIEMLVDDGTTEEPPSLTPEDPPVAPGAVVLQAGDVFEGTVLQSQTLLFQISGATRVRLDSLTGDADLVVGADPTLAVELCESTELPPLSDVCDLDGGDNWVGVFGFTNSEFRLIAEPDTDSPSSAVPIQATLLAGQSVRGSVAQGNFLGYMIDATADGTVAVQLESTNGGDTDLYLFEGPELTDDSLICESNEAQTETCTVTGTGPHVAVVFGFRSADFELHVIDNTAPEPGPGIFIPTPTGPVDADPDGGNAPPSDDDPAPLSGGGSAGGGCSIAGGGVPSAGGAVPLAALFLLLLGGSRRRLLMSAVCGVAAVSAACTPAGVAVEDDSLSLGMASGDPATPEVRVWVSNDSAQAVELLVWNTPFESPLSANLFDVSRDEQAVAYQGRLIKRGAPPAAAWLRLEPGERHEVVVDLSLAYDLSSPGRYRVALAQGANGEVLRFSPSTRPNMPVSVLADAVDLELAS